MKIGEFFVRGKNLYRENTRVCNIIFSILFGCAIGLTTALLLHSKKATAQKETHLILKPQLVENLNCLKIKGQTVIHEERHGGWSYAVFVFPVEAKLSVSLSGLKQQSGDILTLPQPVVTSPRVIHSKNTMKAYQYNMWLKTPYEMEKDASVKAQKKIKEIAGADTFEAAFINIVKGVAK